MPNSTIPDFTHFVGIDWSGAKGTSHKGLAVAICDRTGAVEMVAPPMLAANWSRYDLAAWIASGCGLGGGARILIGIDSAFSLPHADKNYYLPEMKAVPCARTVWEHVEGTCPLDNDFYGVGFTERYRDYVHLPYIGKGDSYERRMRITETLCVESGMGPCESVYHLIGPSQVGMSAFSTMRMLHWLQGQGGVAVWPFDDVTNAPIVLVEIYAALFAKLGGHRGKIRDHERLSSVLKALDCPNYAGNHVIDNHMTDALITAAGLRYIHGESKYWNPGRLSTKVRETEGWIFGIA